MESELEHVLVNSYKADIVSYLHEHPDAFSEALKLAVSDNQPYAWRAAWLLCSCVEKNDTRLQPHIKKIINALKNKKDGHQSGLLKILLQLNLKEEHEGVLFNSCVDIWEDITRIPSVRLYALRLIIKIAKKHPELLNEIGYLIQDQFIDTLSAGVRKSVIKMMKGLPVKTIELPELYYF